MSTLLKLTDKRGNSLHLHNVDGCYFPPVTFNEEKDYRIHLNNLKQFKLRDDDIIIVGYAKSGTHWVWEITGMLLSGTTEYLPQIKESQFLELIDIPTLDALSSPRILNTHLHFRYLPNDVVSKKKKIVYLLRNPKDVAVSLYHHITGMVAENWEYDGTWDDFLDLFLEGRTWNGSWFDFILDWEETCQDHPEIPVCNIYYEDMQQDPESNIKRLAEFLDLNTTSGFCKEIADACAFRKLKHAHEHHKTENFLKDLWKSNHSGFYRKGEVGDWKNWFTVAQNERFDTVYSQKMKDSKLKFRYE